jgi:hypothetical protein
MNTALYKPDVRPDNMYCNYLNLEDLQLKLCYVTTKNMQFPFLLSRVTIERITHKRIITISNTASMYCATVLHLNSISSWLKFKEILLIKHNLYGAETWTVRKREIRTTCKVLRCVAGCRWRRSFGRITRETRTYYVEWRRTGSYYLQ